MTRLMTAAPNRKFKVLQLMNNEGVEKAGYKTPEGMEGINVDLNYLS